MSWSAMLQKWRGGGSIETDLTPYRPLLEEINRAGERIAGESDARLRERTSALRKRAVEGENLASLLVETFALVREAADRQLGLRPFDVQMLAGIALHCGRLLEMQTGEGKTLTAVAPACLNALAGGGAHILTFNDYLARRDAAWMASVYDFFGLSVGVIQEGMSVEARRAAYASSITYATAKEAGFDLLRGELARRIEDLVHREFHYAIVDEADSIFIDEARVPLVIAGEMPTLEAGPERIAGAVAALEAGVDWETDDVGRNVFLTDRGVNRVEADLGCGDLHAAANGQLLTEVHQALHARVLLRRDVDYLVRDGRIELVDEFTGRVVDDRRWPDGLQAAIEAKEHLAIQPGGRILGSITLQHFLRLYPRLSGMTATAQPAAEEIEWFYGLKVVPVPPNRPCRREDLPDLIFTHREAKDRALVDNIAGKHAIGRPVLVGTRSIEESEALAARLHQAGIDCRVLNAKNDEAEAEIIASAGDLGAVTISTNMAGRGTDIRLGGVREERRNQVVALGGLYVIGTNRHESRRIDDQLRGRAGRQGDPGSSRFFVSLEDDLMVRFGIDRLIPKALRPVPQDAPVDHPVIRQEVDRLQRIVEGQNYEIRKTLLNYSTMVEQQRRTIQEWRSRILTGAEPMTLAAAHLPDRYEALCGRFGAHAVEQAERAILLHHIDEAWAEHLSYLIGVREWIHLVGLSRRDPLAEFRERIIEAFSALRPGVEEKTLESFAAVEISADGIDLNKSGLQAPASTWTYLINDRTMSDLQQMLYGPGGTAFAIGAVLSTWPLLAAWGVWRWLKRGK
ncbi:MAG: accessory Sec system translocase SecA2 [Blastocatellales bacterium]|nr:accessory Sec system translocase SecA2 [Blastocatellales bacterium]